MVKFLKVRQRSPGRTARVLQPSSEGWGRYDTAQLGLSCFMLSFLRSLPDTMAYAGRAWGCCCTRQSLAARSGASTAVIKGGSLAIEIAHNQKCTCP